MSIGIFRSAATRNFAVLLLFAENRYHDHFYYTGCRKNSVFRRIICFLLNTLVPDNWYASCWLPRNRVVCKNSNNSLAICNKALKLRHLVIRSSFPWHGKFQLKRRKSGGVIGDINLGVKMCSELLPYLPMMHRFVEVVYSAKISRGTKRSPVTGR